MCIAHKIVSTHNECKVLPITIEVENLLGVDGLVKGVQQSLDGLEFLGAKCATLVTIQSVQM
jgi:hypothetical protein